MVKNILLLHHTGKWMSKESEWFEDKESPRVGKEPTANQMLSPELILVRSILQNMEVLREMFSTNNNQGYYTREIGLIFGERASKTNGL